MVRVALAVSLLVGGVSFLYGGGECDSVLLRIRVYDQSTLKRMSAKVEILHLRTHQKWRIMHVDEHGWGKILLEKRDYSILLFATNYLPVVDYLLLEKTPLCEIDRDFYLVPVDYYLYWKGTHLLESPAQQDTILWIERNGENVAEIPVVFSPEDNTLLPVSINALRQLADHMRHQDTLLKVELRGYVPLNIQDTLYEEKIHKQVAQVRRLLMEFGVDSNRLWEQVAYEAQQATTPEQQLWRWLHQVEIVKVPHLQGEEVSTGELPVPVADTTVAPSENPPPSTSHNKSFDCTYYLMSTTHPIDSLTFYVQVGVFMKGYKPPSIRKLSRDRELAKNLVREPLPNMERYLVGPVATMKDALSLREQMIKEGIPDAFVVPYWGNKRSNWNAVCQKIQTQ